LLWRAVSRPFQRSFRFALVVALTGQLRASGGHWLVHFQQASFIVKTCFMTPIITTPTE